MPVIIALAAVAILVVWLIPETQRQYRYMRTAMVLSGTCLLLVLWLLFLSRLRWSIRLSGFSLVVLAIVAVRLSFRIRGVNGDLLPIVEPRWKHRANLEITTSGTKPARQKAAGEFLQFYGPERNAILGGPAIQSDWASHPPKLLWKQPIGAAWSGFVVKDGLAVTLEQRGDKECVAAYDVLTGKPVWTHTEDTHYNTTIAGEGPRSTPTISSNRIFALGATGILNCLDLEGGNVLWTKDLPKEHGTHPPGWGYAGSPLVLGETVLVSIGGSAGILAAYSADGGKLLWSAGGGEPDYSSPISATLLGVPQIILFANRIISFDSGGKELWHHPWPGGHPHITPPLVITSNLLAVSSGYGTGCELVQVNRDAEGKWTAERLWKSMAPKSKFGPLFHVGDCLYGLDDGIFCCVELKTGQRKWKDGRYGHGQGLLVQNVILLTTEKGEIVLVQPDPEKLVELARFKVFDDKTWNPPALAGDYLLMRNDKEAACLQLSRN